MNIIDIDKYRKEHNLGNDYSDEYLYGSLKGMNIAYNSNNEYNKAEIDYTRGL